MSNLVCKIQTQILILTQTMLQKNNTNMIESNLRSPKPKINKIIRFMIFLLDLMEFTNLLVVNQPTSFRPHRFSFNSSYNIKRHISSTNDNFYRDLDINSRN